MLLSTLCLFAPVLTPAPQGGEFGNEWLGFRREDSRLVAPDNFGLSDSQEKDYAVGDFNRDGLDDLAVVRKRPLDIVGLRRNVLLMNEGGTLVDRTDDFAVDSDVPGDQGFLTRTNDRDVVAVDVDLDGWLDLVTATTLSPNDPKEVSHPRVYRNLGEDNGTWLGFRYEAGRIPQLLLSDGTPSWPRFTSVTAGDVTGDGYPDLYFGDNDQLPGQGGGDMNDRLLINDGAGSFLDESVARMGAAELQTIYTTTVTIRDLNGDGLNDIVRNRGYFQQPRIAYNDPNNVGFFTLHTTLQQSAPYFTSVGDLNRDDRLDLVFAENGNDSLRFNQGNLADGSVDWTAPQNFDFLAGGDDGFGADTYLHDFDLDGWLDVLVCDFDIELGGCNRYMHLYHNLGGVPGSSVTLREEREAAGSGWRGAVGLFANELGGIHDAGILDLDGDGDSDLVLGTCDGTQIYINTTIDGEPVGDAYCECTTSSSPCGNAGADGSGCANSTGVGASLQAFGSNSVAADDLTFVAWNAAPSQGALLYVGTGSVAGGQGLPLGDGLRCVQSGIVRLQLKFTSPDGFASFGPGLGSLGGWSAGDSRFFQVWYRDGAIGPCGTSSNLTNALQVTFAQ